MFESNVRNSVEIAAETSIEPVPFNVIVHFYIIVMIRVLAPCRICASPVHVRPTRANRQDMIR